MLKALATNTNIAVINEIPHNTQMFLPLTVTVTLFVTATGMRTPGKTMLICSSYSPCVSSYRCSNFSETSGKLSSRRFVRRRFRMALMLSKVTKRVLLGLILHQDPWNVTFWTSKWVSTLRSIESPTFPCCVGCSEMHSVHLESIPVQLRVLKNISNIYKYKQFCVMLKELFSHHDIHCRSNRRPSHHGFPKEVKNSGFWFMVKIRSLDLNRLS